MKKYFLFICLLFLINICNLQALGYSGSVNAKYDVINENFYKLSLSNKESILDLNNVKISIIGNDYANVDAIIIPVKDNALNWLKERVNYDINGYYVTFYKAGKKYQMNDDVNIKIETKDYNSISLIDNNGKIITNETILNNYSFESDNSIYIALYNKSYKTAKLDISSGGLLVINKKLYNSNSLISDIENNVQIVIIPDAGYVLDKIYINDVDYTKEVNNGFLYINAIEDNSLIKVTFKEDKSINNGNLSLSGYIYKNNIPISNALVEIHSNKMVTYTNNEGYFEFKNVSYGKHSITVYENNNIIGYREFVIENIKNNKQDIIDNYILNTKNRSTLKYNFYVDNNLNIEFKPITVKSRLLFVFLILLVVLFIVYMICFKRKKYKKIV